MRHVNVSFQIQLHFSYDNKVEFNCVDHTENMVTTGSSTCPETCIQLLNCILTHKQIYRSTIYISTAGFTNCLTAVDVILTYPPDAQPATKIQTCGWHILTQTELLKFVLFLDIMCWSFGERKKTSTNLGADINNDLCNWLINVSI